MPLNGRRKNLRSCRRSYMIHTAVPRSTGLAGVAMLCFPLENCTSIKRFISLSRSLMASLSFPPSTPPHLSLSVFSFYMFDLPYPMNLSWGTAQSGSPYVAVFLRKEPEWNQAAGSDGEAVAAPGAGGGEATTPDDASAAGENKDGVIDGTTENAVQQTYPEVITSLDEIHEVGTLAQVCVRSAVLPVSYRKTRGSLYSKWYLIILTPYRPKPRISFDFF